MNATSRSQKSFGNDKAIGVALEDRAFTDRLDDARKTDPGLRFNPTEDGRIRLFRVPVDH